MAAANAASQRSPRSTPRRTKPRQSDPARSTEAKSASDTPGTSDQAEQDPTDVFKNYRFAASFIATVLFCSNLIVMALLVTIAFAAPSQMGGGLAMLKTSDEFVGVLRKCSSSSCEAWMAGGASEGGFGYGNMFLTLGLATVTSLWFSMFIVLFHIYRIFRRLPPVEGGNVFDGIARYVYRAGRCLLIVNVILIPSLMIDVIVKAVSYRSSKSIQGFSIIGGGIASFLFTLLSTLIELRGSEGRTHRWIMKLSCGIGGPDDPKRSGEASKNEKQV